MKLNYETCLVNQKIILVPYRPQHVPRYHEWMKDPALLEATGSEPLSLQEEEDMQQTWRDDQLKCTFIVHAREACTGFLKDSTAAFRVEDNVDGMVGDVNLFLSEMEDEDDQDDEDDTKQTTKAGTTIIQSSSGPRIQAEIDIMIAEKDYRGKGFGRAATCAMVLYGLTELNIQRFFCKINEDNESSLNLFKSIGFQQCDYAACFKQIELDLKKPVEEMREMFELHGGNYTKASCPLTDKRNNEI